MECARYKLFTRNKKSPKVMALPPTSTNMLLHILRSNLQIMLWKAADEQAPPQESADITQFGWDIKEGIPIPVTDQGDPAPPQLIDVICCQCKVQGKQCCTGAYGNLSCTSYCHCSGEEGCDNPYTRRPGEEDVQDDFIIFNINMYISSLLCIHKLCYLMSFYVFMYQI